MNPYLNIKAKRFPKFPIIVNNIILPLGENGTRQISTLIMIRKMVLFILVALFPKIILGQTETYSVIKSSFCSDKYDEFSPVFYKEGLVFTSNRNQGLSNHLTSQNKGLFKIYYVDTIGKAGLESTRLFSKNLTSILNDGPVTILFDTKNKE